jgi:hypothetical protein
MRIEPKLVAHDICVSAKLGETPLRSLSAGGIICLATERSSCCAASTTFINGHHVVCCARDSGVLCHWAFAIGRVVAYLTTALCSAVATYCLGGDITQIQLPSKNCLCGQRNQRCVLVTRVWVQVMQQLSLEEGVTYSASHPQERWMVQQHHGLQIMTLARSYMT